MRSFAEPSRASGASRADAGAPARRLPLSAPGDRWEREADAAAERALDPRRGARPSLTMPTALGASSVQRMCAGCAEDEERVQRKPQSGTSAGTGAHVDAAATARIEAARGRGAPLPDGTRRFFEPRFGYDLSRVRVHADGEGASLSRALSARAFTVGSDVYFGAGEFAPDSHAGRRLIAHELAHAVQQRDLPAFAQRVQRATTDADFEKAYGVDTAVAAGTMKTVPGVHGTTFEANGCGGKPACKVGFTFTRALMGLHKYQGDDLRGISVSISMGAKTNDCGACDTLKPIQVYSFNSDVGGKLTPIAPDTDKRKDRTGWNDPKAPSRGWSVDALDSDTTPFYVTSEFFGQSGSATKQAVLRDAPGSWAFKSNVGKEFRTCAVCYDGGGKGRVLGCVSWGYLIDGSKNITFRPTPAATCAPATEFSDAVKRWEGLRGNDKANITP
jgi:hypothetical protein